MRRGTERPLPSEAGLQALALLRCVADLLDDIVTFAYRGGEFLAQSFCRIAKIIAPNSGGFRKCRIGEVRAITNSGAIFFDLYLPLQIGGHLVEFPNNAFQVLDLARLFLNLAALQKHGGFA